jgi:hypothetical protein
MMRRHGKVLSEWDGIGYGQLPYAAQKPQRSSQPQFARGSMNHPDGDIDPWTGA